MKALILTGFVVLGLAGGLTIKGLWSIQSATPATAAAKARPPESQAASKPIPQLNPEAPVSTYFTVKSPDGTPCHVRLVQTSGAGYNLMNLVTDCPQEKGAWNWKSSQMSSK